MLNVDNPGIINLFCYFLLSYYIVNKIILTIFELFLRILDEELLIKPVKIIISYQGQKAHLLTDPNHQKATN